MDILLVDGYNIIGAWPELRELKNKDLSSARDRLIEKMAEYQGYSGYRVIVVFDAHYVKGTEKSLRIQRSKLFSRGIMKRPMNASKNWLSISVILKLKFM